MININAIHRAWQTEPPPGGVWRRAGGTNPALWIWLWCVGGVRASDYDLGNNACGVCLLPRLWGIGLSA